MALNIAVLGSTRGTDLQAVIDAIKSGKLDARISIVISNRPDASILERAKNSGISAKPIESKGKSREAFDKELLQELEPHRPDLILLIGYMRFLSDAFVQKYRNRIMNIHPSLLPAFAGGMDRNVHQAVLDAKARETGCTLHFVDETPDGGPIILQKIVAVAGNDTADSLKEKVQEAEQEIIVEGLKLFAEGRLKVEGKRVKIL
ncbi:MAG: phosphoribosylglycinamide formyltransferase [Candidatus Diapherotrites archaeon]|nr:phosphoribosylglycinamide formyltransferase [Candidatus Diapherotrites archaeon]